MIVNEDPWIARCPRCGNTAQNVQCPVTLATPPQCAECEVNPWVEKSDYKMIQYYICLRCNQRYLIPKVEARDILLGALDE